MSSTPALGKSAGPRWRKRQDIQLLRAVAVLAVVGYHFGLGGFQYGFLGVDIFLVISGYLVGGGLLSEYRTSGRIDVRRFFTHRIKRLLPASVVVVIATTLLLYATNELTTRDLRHALWSSLYVQNINLSFEGGDYLGKDLLPTYFVHFWSLSLEEQFYVFTPIILLLVALTKLKRPLIIFSAIGIASLALSLYQTSIGDSSAYFSLTTRAWQFILGMVVANLNPSRTYARALWTISILGVGVFTLLINFDLGLLFPAPGAIIPSVITALALVAGKSVPLKIPIAGLQSTGVFIGDLSYSIYLVHFPISLLVASWIGKTENLFFVTGGLILTLTIAFVLKTLVEDPVRFPGFYGPRFKFGVVKILLSNMALALSLVLTIQGFSFAADNQSPDTTYKPAPTAESPIATKPPEPTAEYCFGANAMIKDICGAFILSKPVLPPQSANEAVSKAYSNGCHIQFSSRPRFKSCTYGTTKGYKTTIALVGDSHATQWLPAFDVAGKASGVRIKTFLMSECVYGSVLFVTKCKDFAPWVLSSISKPGSGFSAIYISNRVSRPELQPKLAYLKRSFTKTLKTLQTTNLKIFLIGDTPLGTLDHTDPNLCLMKKQPKDCFGLTKDVIWKNPFAEAVLESGVGEYVPVDNLFCIGTKCYKSIGGVPVYRDDDHINVWYSKSTIDIWKTRFSELLKRPGA
ncbi:MAG: acyltransferase family protein [Rhodoluna sp.]|nr:acyltransferase family protein [Rhodoluna sp.]